MHPGEHRDGYILALVSRPECERTYYDDTVTCAKDLMLTTDFGRTEWRNLTDSSDNDIVSFVDFDWGTRSRSYAQRSERFGDRVYE